MISYFMIDSKLHVVKRTDFVEDGSSRGEDEARKEHPDQPVGLIKNKDDLEKRDDGYAKFSFNLLVSDRIGYHRKLPDTRHQL